ncbi:MAG: hypothetical protein ACP5JB_05390 [candidate division WOR-3 bacterium]
MVGGRVLGAVRDGVVSGVESAVLIRTGVMNEFRVRSVVVREVGARVKRLVSGRVRKVMARAVFRVAVILRPVDI